MRYCCLFPYLLGAATLVFAPGAFAEESYSPPSSNPQDLHVLRDFVYFTADDGIHGREIWRSDAQGTVALVADITPGPESTEISKLSNFGELLLFRVDPAGGGSELWKTDGTAEGTRRVKQFNGDIKEGFDGVCGVWDSGKAFIRVVSGTPAFWQTDGTEEGTQPLPMTTEWQGPIGADYAGVIQRGFFYFAGQHPIRGPILARCDAEGRMVTEIDQLTTHARDITEIDANRLIFRSSDNMNGEELFVSGGTAEHTFMVHDIAAGPLESAPTLFTVISFPDRAPQIVFVADDGVHGRELWITDGTGPGTRMVTDLWPGRDSGSPSAFVVLGYRVFFAAKGLDIGKELWSVGPPYETASAVGDIRPGVEGSDPYALCALPGHGVFFSALGDGLGEEIYMADASGEHATLVRDIYPGEKSSSPYYTVAIGNLVIFAATDPVHGRELWCADGDGQARLLADIYTDGNVNPSSSPQQLTPAGNLLYFVANDIAHGAELWVSDGKGTGTRLVKDVFPGRAGSSPDELTPAESLLYFTAEDGANGFRLWQTDGSDEGTVIVSLDAANPQNLTALESTLFFCAQSDGTGLELWVARPGRPAGLLRDIAKGAASSTPRNLVVFQGALYFLADDGIHGEELWRCDGTEAGTVMVRDIVEVPYEEIRFEVLAPAANALFMAAGSSSQGIELWRYVENEDRPAPVKDIAFGIGRPAGFQRE